MVTVGEIYDVLDQWAPFAQAEEWDSAGLQIGCRSARVNSALLCLDVTSDALEFAGKEDCQLIISHHPLIFSPIKSVLCDRPGEKLVYSLISRNISLIAAHTNLDAAPGGVADVLCAAILAAIGLEKSTISSLSSYGRCLVLPQFLTLQEIRQRTAALAGPDCRVNSPADRRCAKVAVYPGSLPEEEIEIILGAEADLVICGEIKHHINVQLADCQVAVLDIGHARSERLILRPLADRLKSHFRACRFAVHQAIDYNITAY